MTPKPDFSGWATKNNLLCSDGRTIRKDAFAHNDGATVPLVWQHQHNDVNNVLGHAVLENRKEGVYTYGFFNNSPKAEQARELVKHGDIKSLSIYANQLVQKDGDVLHGKIRELSLVLTGANPGAYIENVNLSHSDSPDGAEVVIFSGLEEYLIHADGETPEVDDTTNDVPNDVTNEGAYVPTENRTHQDIIDGMSEEEKNTLYYMVGKAIDDSENGELDADLDDEDAFDDDEDLEQQDLDENYLSHYGETMNVFDNGGYESPEPVISHADIQQIVNDAQRSGSLKDSFLAHAQSYGIENIDILFPNAKSFTGPEFLKRQDEWVTKILNGTHKSPFARIKSIAADITADEARAKGYIKGNQKKDEVIKLLKRETTPTTIYKKQKLDRDDIIDITDLDVVAWLKGEMKLMLNEEIARAILFGDGRQIDDADKVKEDNIRPIAKDVAPFTSTVTAVKTGDTPYADLIKQIVRARKYFRGSGSPSLYTSTDVITEMLLLEDKMGRVIYEDIDKLKLKLRVKDIVEVPDALFKHLGDVMGVIVNLSDYTLGSDKGGETTMFDDFDIDFNRQKYLIETRLSGCLTKPESAIILKWGTTAEIVPGFSDTGNNFDADGKLPAVDPESDNGVGT